MTTPPRRLSSRSDKGLDVSYAPEGMSLAVADRTQITATLAVGNKVGSKRLEFKKP
jgi:hypothetical protein